MAKKAEAVQTPTPKGNIVLYDLDELRLWDGNYNEGDIGMITQSIRQFGFNRAVAVWKDKQVRAGNHSVLSLREIKQEGYMETDLSWPPKNVIVRGDRWFIPCVDISHLSEEKALGFAIADNRAAQLATQDETVLAAYLSDLYERNPELMDATGYDEDDIQYMLAVSAQPVVAADHQQTPEEAFDTYVNGQIKQVVLYYDPAGYVATIKMLTIVMREAKIDTNTDAVAYVLHEWFERRPDLKAELERNLAQQPQPEPEAEDEDDIEF